MKSGNDKKEKKPKFDLPYVTVRMAKESPTRGEIHGKKTKTIQLGYVSIQRRIEYLAQSGQQLQLARADQYDHPEGQPTDGFPINPTKVRNFDLADATEITDQLNQKQETINNEQTEKLAAEQKEEETKKADKIKSDLKQQADDSLWIANQRNKEGRETE